MHYEGKKEGLLSAHGSGLVSICDHTGVISAHVNVQICDAEGLKCNMLPSTHLSQSLVNLFQQHKNHHLCFF